MKRILSLLGYCSTCQGVFGTHDWFPHAVEKSYESYSLCMERAMRQLAVDASMNNLFSKEVNDKGNAAQGKKHA